MAVDPYHRYSNEAERANEDIYDDFKLKKPFGLHGLCKDNSALYGLKIRTLTLYLIFKLSYIIFHPFEVVSRGNLK